MYWVVLACGLLLESWTEWILVWWVADNAACRPSLTADRIPFYPWMRAFVLLYLVLPQTQGARMLYQSYIHPFLWQHESEIDTFISSAHDRAKAAGLQYLKQAIEMVKEHIFGMPPRKNSPPSPAHGGSYAQSLLAQFNLPARRDGFAVPAAGDFYGLLSAALGHTMASSAGEARAGDLSASGTLIPSNIQSKEERMSYITTQRERLRVLVQALDNEATNLSNRAGPAVPVAGPSAPRMLFPQDDAGATLRKSTSEGEFERVEREDLGDEDRAAAAGWMPWNWGGKAASAQPNAVEGQQPAAVSSSIDTTHRS